MSPKDFTARPATMDEVEAAVELANAYSIKMISKPQLEAHELHNDWGSPNLKIQTDLHLVFAPDDRLVGYAGVWDRKPNLQIHAWGKVHPAYKSRGIGTYLAQWIERRARRSIAAKWTCARNLWRIKATQYCGWLEPFLCAGGMLFERFQNATQRGRTVGGAFSKEDESVGWLLVPDHER